MTHKQTKILLITIIALSLIFIIYCSLLFMISQNKNNAKNTENTNTNVNNTTKTVTPVTEKFMLKSVNNKVYTFEILNDGSINQVGKTSIDTKYMREVDKKSLADGIYVNTKNELLSLIEDFSS